MFHAGAQIQIADRIRRAARDPHAAALQRRRDNARTAAARAPRASTELVVRMLDDADGPAVERLAELDSSELPAGRLLGANSDGKLIAALSLDDETVIADPFRNTRGAVELLRLRAAQLRDSEGRRRFRLPRLPRARGAIAGSPPGGGSNLLEL